MSAKFGARGTANHIVLDCDLWLVVIPAVKSRWYPVNHLSVATNSWQIPADEICPNGAEECFRMSLHQLCPWRASLGAAIFAVGPVVVRCATRLTGLRAVVRKVPGTDLIEV
jgi:hypothetical protein